jgi:SSS family solute:Na+ symporter
MEQLDWIVIGVFVAALIGIVVWVMSQKQNSSGDYFLAGRDATWVAIGASILASNIGSEHLIGLAGAGASSGMAMAHWEIQGWMILILGWVFVPFYSRSMVLTMPEFLERRYNPESRTILSVISLISYVLTKCRRTCIPAGFWNQRNLGNRLFLDCSHWFGFNYSTLHCGRGDEIGTLYFGTSNTHFATRLTYYCSTWAA